MMSVAPNKKDSSILSKFGIGKCLSQPSLGLFKQMAIFKTSNWPSVLLWILENSISCWVGTLRSDLPSFYTNNVFWFTMIIILLLSSVSYPPNLIPLVFIPSTLSPVYPRDFIYFCFQGVREKPGAGETPN